MSIVKNLFVIGGVVQQLTIISNGYLRLSPTTGRPNKKSTVYLCRCSCGNEVIVRQSELKDTKRIRRSCGCLIKESTRKLKLTHGMTRTRLYRIYQNMKTRCYNNKVSVYKRYGGRGISICKEWGGFESFHKWAIGNGYSENLQIDRINNNGNYEPGNCRWVTSLVNGNNCSTSVLLNIFGEVKTMAEWSRDSRCAVCRGTFTDRVRYGVDHEIALTTKRLGPGVRRKLLEATPTEPLLGVAFVNV